MDLQQMELTPFVSEEIGKKRRLSAHRNITWNKKRRRALSASKNPAHSTSMLVKIGICAAVCLTVLLLKWINAPATNQVLDGMRSAISEQTDFDKVLGKLQFVELPNVAEVFSSNSSKMTLPVNASSVVFEEEQYISTWQGVPSEEVSAAASGQVKGIGEDETWGKYVRLSHADDLETIYYGFSDINVEEGQPIRRLDTLGTLNETGMLHLLVLQGGRPQEPGAYFDVTVENRQ